MNDFIVHIGLSKTGSSFIQKNLIENNKFFYKKNYIYDHYFDKVYGTFNTEKAGNGKFFVNFFKEKANNEKLIKFIDLLNQNYNYIFSSEYLIPAILKYENLIEFKKLLNYGGFNLKLIMLIRSPLDHLISSYCQQFKFIKLEILELESFSHKKDFFMPKINIDDINKILDEENFIILNYDEIKKDLFKIFCNKINITDTADLIIDKNIINESLNFSDTFLLKYLSEIDILLAKKYHKYFFKNSQEKVSINFLPTKIIDNIKSKTELYNRHSKLKNFKKLEIFQNAISESIDYDINFTSLQKRILDQFKNKIFNREMFNYLAMKSENYNDYICLYIVDLHFKEKEMINKILIFILKNFNFHHIFQEEFYKRIKINNENKFFYANYFNKNLKGEL